MADRDISLKIILENQKKTSDEIEQLKKKITTLGTTTKTAGKKAKLSYIDTAKSVRDLQNNIKFLAKELNKAEIGSKKFNAIQKKLQLTQRKLNTAIKDSGGSFDFMRVKTEGLRRTLGAIRNQLLVLFFALKGFKKVLNIAKEALNFAKNAAEIQNKFNVVFKGMEKEANEWAETFAKSMGRATQDIKSFESSLGDVLKPLGFTTREAKDMSEQMVKLALDVASFNNRQDPEVIQAFVRALTGERESLKTLGIVISEADVKQEAYNAGLAQQGQELSRTAKALATVNLLHANSKDAQGDLIRTSESLVNIEKRKQAVYKDMMKQWGEKLIPLGKVWNKLLTSIYHTMTPLVSEYEKAEEKSRKQIATFDRLVRIYKDLHNKTEKTRVENKLYQDTIDALNKQYGEYLGNLDLEKSAWDDITKGINNAREALIEKAKTDAIIGLTIDLQKELTKESVKEEKLLKTRYEWEEYYNKEKNKTLLFEIQHKIALQRLEGRLIESREKQLKLLEDIDYYHRNYPDLFKKIREELEEGGETRLTILTDDTGLKQVIRTLDRLQKKALTTQAKLDAMDVEKGFARSVALIAKEVDLQIEANQKKMDSLDELRKKQGKLQEQDLKAYKALQEQNVELTKIKNNQLAVLEKQYLEKYREDWDKWQTETIDNQFEKERIKTKDQYDDLLKQLADYRQAQIALIEKSKLPEEEQKKKIETVETEVKTKRTKLITEREEKITEITDKELRNRQQKIIEYNVLLADITDDELQKSLLNLEKNYLDKIDKLQEYKELELQINKTFFENGKISLEEYEQRSSEIKMKYAQDEIDIEKWKTEQITDINKESRDELDMFMASGREKEILDIQINHEKQLDLLQENFEQGLISWKEYSDKKKELILTAEVETDLIRLEQFQQFTNAVGDLGDALYNHEKQRLDQKMQDEIAAVNQSGMNEEQKRAKIDKIRDKYEKKELDAKKKLLPVKLAMATSDLAVAVVKALASAAPPWNFILAGLVAAAGAIQIATIASQKYAKGIIDVKGPGTETSDSIPVRISKRESVITAKTTKKYKEELSAMEKGDKSYEKLVYSKYLLLEPNFLGILARSAKGNIDYKGQQIGTSVSIPAKISKGESIIDAETTQEYIDDLQAMEKGHWDYIKVLNKKYILPFPIFPPIPNLAEGYIPEDFSDTLLTIKRGIPFYAEHFSPANNIRNTNITYNANFDRLASLMEQNIKSIQAMNMELIKKEMAVNLKIEAETISPIKVSEMNDEGKELRSEV